MSDAAPDWELLERDPESFFGLESGWGRRELKRAYGAWARRFKPDREPDQFMRLRAAYEALEDRLRFGSEAASPVDGFAALSRPTGGDGPSGTEPATEPESWPDTEEVVARVQRLGAGAALTELRAEHPGWNLPDYVACFFQGDEPSGDEHFVEALLEGLRERPQAIARLALLRAFYRHAGERLDASAELARLEGLSSNAWVALATPLLRELARAGEDQPLVAALERMERATDRAGVEARRGALAELLLPAATVCDLAQVETWANELEVDASGEGLGDHERFALDALIAWRKEPEGEPAPGPLELELEACLVEAAIERGPLRLAALRRAAERLRESELELCHEMRPGCERQAHLASALSGLAAEGQVTAHEPTGSRSSALEFTRRIEAETDASLLGHCWNVSSLLLMLACVLLAIGLCLPLVALLASRGASQAGWLITAPAGLGALILFRQYSGLWLGGLHRFFARRLYRTIWRRPLMQWIARQHRPLRDLLMELVACDSDPGVTNATLLVQCAVEDPALSLTVTARELET